MPAKDPSKAVVLVADDEPSMLSLIAQHVKTLGHDVHVAHDGEEAWDMVQKHRPDLVLLDVMMPAMSGWEVCRKVREDEGFEQVGVIMITGIGETLNELTSPLFGADAYLDKPFELVDLDRSIREVLAKRRNGPTKGAEARGGGGGAKPTSGKSKAAAKVKGE
jgi:DNA-binding response OmpR family regulator